MRSDHCVNGMEISEDLVTRSFCGLVGWKAGGSGSKRRRGEELRSAGGDSPEAFAMKGDKERDSSW